MQKKILVILLTTCIVALAMLGGNWSKTFADTIPTIPTIPKAPPHKENPNQPGPAQTPTLGVTSKSVPIGPTTSGNPNFSGLGGADFPTGSACQDGIVVVYRVPVPFVPYRWLMWYYEDVLQVQFYVKGATDHAPPCGTFQVYYDLKPYERNIYDSTPNKIGIFFFDQGSNSWSDCKAMLEPTMSDYGRLVCTTNKWGFYALGQIAPK